MNLNTKSWKDFKLENLFDVTAGIYHYSDEYNDGSTNYLSASNTNNGVSQKIDLNPEFKGNCIVTGKVGCTAFYQKDDFCATSDVNILRPKFELNEYIGLFIVAVINESENYKWCYGRQCRIQNTKNITIKLPIKYNNDNPVLNHEIKYNEDGYIPDFEFMECYIKSLYYKPITTDIKSDITQYDIKTWQEFRFGDLVSNIYKAEAHVKNDMEIYSTVFDNAMPFISRTEANNGCDCYVENKNLTGIERGNAIVIGDTTATCSYQPKEFICGDHMVICRADWLNLYTGLFIITLLNKERYRYNYGRAFNMSLIQNTMLKLPASGGKPDWKWMENYIKGFPYSDRIK